MPESSLYLLRYDSGHRDQRMGAGPDRIRRELGVAGEEIEPELPWRSEISTSFQLYRQLAKRIAATPETLPIVLAGNCGASIGTAAGVGVDDLGVIWFDAHGDFNTPETSLSGYLDGMCLSVLTGRCFVPLAATIPGFAPIPFENTVHVGGHALDQSETKDFHRLDVARIPAGGDVRPVLESIAARTSRILVHVDLDVLDVQYGRANQYACSGGLSPAEVENALIACTELFDVAAIVLASYDPSYDDGRVAAAAARFVEIVQRNR